VLSLTALPASPEVLELLVELLRPGDDVGARNSAVEALASFGVHAIPALARELGVLDADGRKLAVEVLGRSARPEALPVLEALLGDADPNVRAAAIEAVAAVGESAAGAAITLLADRLVSEDRFERLAALSGLNRLLASVPWAQLEPLARDPILLPEVLRAAARAGDAQAVPALVAALSSAERDDLVALLAPLAELSRASAVAHRELLEAARGASSRVVDAVLALVADEDAPLELRRDALAAAPLLAGPRAAPVAIAALAEDSLAEVAERSLSELGTAAVPALVAGVSAPAAAQRAACAALLGPLVGVEPEANAAVKRALSDPAPEVVAAALDSLALAGDAHTLAEACALLSAGPLVARAAHRAVVVVARRFPDAGATLVSLADPSAASAEAAALVIESQGLGVPDLELRRRFLASALDNELPAARRAALLALAVVGGAESVPAVAFAAGDEEPDVRSQALRTLGALTRTTRSEAGYVRLTEIVTSPGEPELVAEAARALGSVGDPRAVPVLAGLVGSEPLLAVAAIDALGAFSPTERLGCVEGALGHSDSEVVKAAQRVLAASPEAASVEALGATVDHEDWEVRRLAAELLCALGGDRALELLRGRLTVEEHALVHDELIRAIAELETAAGRRRTAPPPSLRGGRGA
jgi:HEAT repeat protein